MSTKIEWTHRPGTKGETWNPIVGCSEVSPGCRHCYAAGVAHRGMQEAHRGLTVMKSNGVHWNGTVRRLPERLEIPLKWKKPRTVFVCSMSDLFHEDLADEYIAAVFGVMAASPQHTFQVLTKRADEMRGWFKWVDDSSHGHPRRWCHEFARQHVGGVINIKEAKVASEWPLPNVWLGVSAEDQQRADERIPLLLDCPAAVRWVSAEPLLGSIDLNAMSRTPGAADDEITEDDNDLGPPLGGVDGLDWVVIGGESGPGARPCGAWWVRDIVSQCQATATAVFVKQLGAVAEESYGNIGVELLRLKDRKGGNPDEWPADLRVRQYPETSVFDRPFMARRRFR